MLAQDSALPDIFQASLDQLLGLGGQRGSEPPQASLQVDQAEVSQRPGRERAHWPAENTQVQGTSLVWGLLLPEGPGREDWSSWAHRER